MDTVNLVVSIVFYMFMGMFFALMAWYIRDLIKNGWKSEIAKSLSFKAWVLTLILVQCGFDKELRELQVIYTCVMLSSAIGWFFIILKEENRKQQSKVID